MKRLLPLLLTGLITANANAQNEGRFGIFAGVNRTELTNAKDKSWGDYLPTFKPNIGVDAGYHFTLFKKLPMGFSVQLARTELGQNYHGEYQDSSSYYAYSRLTYLRPGIAMHFGTNPRRLFALTFSAGASYGILTGYTDRYELIRYNNDRFIIDLKNTDAVFNDTSIVTGTLREPLYNKTDLSVFGTLGFDVLMSKNFVFGVYGRYDYGMSQIENRNLNAVILNTEPQSTLAFNPYQVAVKHRGPVDPNVKRDPTTNTFYGVYLSLKYRLFNPEKIEFWYKEHKWD